MEWLYDCDEKVRIDKFLSLQLPEESRSFLQKLIKEEACRVNGRPVKPNYLCCRGDQIDLLLPERKFRKQPPLRISLWISYLRMMIFW